MNVDVTSGGKANQKCQKKIPEILPYGIVFKKNGYEDILFVYTLSNCHHFKLLVWCIYSVEILKIFNVPDLRFFVWLKFLKNVYTCVLMIRILK